MNSIFALLFLAIQARIKAVLNEDTDVIRHIDQDYNQFEAPKPPVAFPCVLIDMEEFTASNMGDQAQTLEGIVLIRLGFMPYSNTSGETPAQWKEKGLNYYDIEQKLHLALHCWEPTSDEIKALQGEVDGDFDNDEVVYQFGGLTRVKANTDRERISELRIRELRYSIVIQDYSTLAKLTMTPATLKIEPELLIE